ncbi:MAG: hypothetical protein LQ352_003921 [Teloschistes flavicans]|nr:MAG: hypothetical protein LQ352_003921 [Teloschistes flavicans]
MTSRHAGMTVTELLQCNAEETVTADQTLIDTRDRARETKTDEALHRPDDMHHPMNCDPRSARDEPRGYNDYWRDRPRSPDARRRGYVDRDREGYRSPGYNGRSRSRSRSRSPQRRDRSPYFGGPPSREVIMEGIPLDISEEDVRHHSLAHSTIEL